MNHPLHNEQMQRYCCKCMYQITIAMWKHDRGHKLFRLFFHCPICDNRKRTAITVTDLEPSPIDGRKRLDLFES